VVLLYHRISDDDSDDPGGMVVPPSLFREHMEAVKRSFTVVPAAEIMDSRESPAATITLDDGYLDNWHEAVPVLRELSLPATFFVVSDTLTDRAPGHRSEFWWDRLEHLLLEPGAGPATLEVTVRGRRVPLGLTDRASRRDSYLRLTTELQRQSPVEARRVLTKLEAAFPREATGCDRHRRMTAEQVRALAHDPLFDIGSHTCSHAALARLPSEESHRELTESRDVLQTLLGAPPALLAYPYGAPGTVSRANARAARSAGYRFAFANVAGPVEGANPFAVPRITVGRWSVEHLQRALTAWRRAG
jgi:peptidoglycan/xylan/chitin deacetylase (PgdA/CDA1 family)